MAEVFVSVRNDQDTVKIPVGMRSVVRKCCKAVLDEEGFDDKAEISVYFITNEKIKELNKEFRGKNKVTDVLSFPLGENGEFDENPETGALLLGDIVISLEKAFAQAKEYGHSFEREVAYLATHSMLHLLGYDHVNGGQEELIMRSKEEKILTSMNIRREGK